MEMAEAMNYRYGVIHTLDEAVEAAAEAEAEGFLGYYPAACVVLRRELKRWEEAHAEWPAAQSNDDVPAASKGVGNGN
jgi:rubrerythrin